VDQRWRRRFVAGVLVILNDSLTDQPYQTLVLRHGERGGCLRIEHNALERQRDDARLQWGVVVGVDLGCRGVSGKQVDTHFGAFPGREIGGELEQDQSIGAGIRHDGVRLAAVPDRVTRSKYDLGGRLVDLGCCGVLPRSDDVGWAGELDAHRSGNDMKCVETGPATGDVEKGGVVAVTRLDIPIFEDDLVPCFRVADRECRWIGKEADQLLRRGGVFHTRILRPRRGIGHAGNVEHHRIAIDRGQRVGSCSVLKDGRTSQHHPRRFRSFTQRFERAAILVEEQHRFSVRNLHR
jgi:hypothetical protein